MTARLYFTLLLIILMEGFVVLAYELIAMRLSIPFVGSGSDSIAIIIASVLMPLAFGYQSGGRFKPYIVNGKRFSVREKLAQNVRIASVFVLFGISYFSVDIFFKTMIDGGTHDRLVLTAIYCAVFLVVPVYLLGQTIPLVSNFFSKKRLPRVTGTILFVSTIGSFLGAVFSTVILMSLIGVNYTAFVCLALLAAILLIIGGKQKDRNYIIALFILGIGFFMNNTQTLSSFNIVAFNQYNMVKVFEDEDGSRHISLNGNASSKITKDKEAHAYIEFYNQHFIYPSLEKDDKAPMDILVIGTGGFTTGIKDTKNNYFFIDIDKNLKDISEEHFLKEELSENKIFIPSPARAYLAQSEQKFDIIVIDVFLGQSSLPEHLMTVEFFAAVKEQIKDGGVILTNFITSTLYGDKFSRNLDATLRSVYPFISRQIISDFDGFEDEFDVSNVVYIYRHREGAYDDARIYRDIKNPIFWDIPSKMRAGKAKKTAPEDSTLAPTENEETPE